jgi:DNA-binding NarL/FixJ family response regulator
MWNKNKSRNTFKIWGGKIMIKAMLADDHVLVREGIKHLLEYDGTVEVIQEANNGIECIEKLADVSPDILLLDINMPDMNGIEVLEELKRREHPVKILILTVHNEIEYLIRAVDIGADGYILKDSGTAELKQAITTIINGESYIQPSLLPALNSRLINRDIDKEKLESLTKRELEILIQVAGGMFNKEIAINLNISERTVKNHISNIFKKIDVSDRTQAAVFAIRNNIVKLY